MSLRITRNIQIGLFTSLNWMWNSGYVIKVEMALSIISVNFWSILTQKVNWFYINVNWFSDIWLCKVVKKYCAVTMSLQSLSDSLNDISCKMSLRNQYKRKGCFHFITRQRLTSNLGRVKYWNWIKCRDILLSSKSARCQKSCQSCPVSSLYSPRTDLANANSPKDCGGR